MLAAIDANTGRLKWEVPMGNVPWMEKSLGAHPEWGSPALGGAIVVDGLVFMGATFDPYLKAYDEATGTEVWRGKLPTSARATPMTFRSESGKRYIVIAAGGHDVPGAQLSDVLVAFLMR
jgi:quinoprotein glucose dehydrogenase